MAPVDQQHVRQDGGDVENRGPEPVDVEAADDDDGGELCDHTHASHRSPWLRAMVLGANDGLVSVASIMLGVGGGNSNGKTLILAGVAAWVAGALSMAVGELISVYSQRDTEKADIQKEIDEQNKGPQARLLELRELTNIYINRGLSPDLARQVAEELTEKDVIRAHARDELGIDLDDLSNPWQAAFASAIAFTVGAIFPIIPAIIFSHNHVARLISVLVGSTLGMIATGVTGAVLGGAGVVVPTLRVLLGGWVAMAITFGVGRAFRAGGVTS